MTTVNINRKVTDSYYRYKMPKIQAKVEGRGNGIKTVVVNLIEVSRALQRPPLYPLKFIGCELGAQTIADTKNERFIVNGAHDADKLQNILDVFIEKYVLCAGCSNPETNLSVYPKKEQIVMKCTACGHTCKVPTAHRVSTYILKNPPTNTTKDKQQNKKSQKTSNNANTTTSASTIDKDTYNSSFAAEKNAPNNSCIQSDENENDEHWNIDLSEDAVKRRQQMLSSNLRALTLDNDVDKPIHEKLEILRQFINDRLNIDKNLSNHYGEIVGEARRLEIENKAIFAISSAIFDHNIVKQLTQHYVFLRRFCSEQHRIQKYLLGSIERIIEQYMDQLITKVPIVFKIMFEAEIVDEAVFLEWDSKSSSRYVAKETLQKIKTAGFKFMDWLKNAEEESTSSEDESPTNVNTIDSPDCHNDQSSNITSLHSSGNYIQTLDHHSHNNHDDDKSDLNIDDI